MFCIYCGEILPDESRFCIKCGKSVFEDVLNEETVKYESAQKLTIIEESTKDVTLKEDSDKKIPDEWETCEINYKVTHMSLTGTKGFFSVDAKGLSGKYVAERSDEFSCGFAAFVPDIKNNSSQHKAILESLEKKGWEATGEKGDTWWNTRFRRVATGR